LLRAVQQNEVRPGRSREADSGRAITNGSNAMHSE